MSAHLVIDDRRVTASGQATGVRLAVRLIVVGDLDSWRVDLWQPRTPLATLNRVRALQDTEWQTPRPLIEEWDWQYQGSCRRLPPEVFFPEDSGRTGLRGREERAKAICRSCPVVDSCRDHALAVRETHGVWGATSARDRAKLLLARSDNAYQ